MATAIPVSTDELAISAMLAEMGGTFPMDEAVIKAMPKGTKVVSAEPYGNSAWTTTARVSVIQPDGTSKRYFLKCATGDHGGKMMRGEFTAISTIYENMPHFVPAPLGWGKYTISPVDGVDTYFFIEDFLDMEISIPEPVQFTSKVAEMHQTITSPNGKFGFPVVTYDGKVPHTVAWEKSWAVFFTNLLKGVLAIDTEANGIWPEMEAAANQLFSAVIPRLLGVLQSDGREIKGSLIHGDLWAGNIGTLLETGDIVLFDAGSYYAHNEMDTAMWRCARHQYIRSRVYTRNYMRYFEPAEPEEEWDDRNRLYSLKYNLNYSIGHPGNISRDMAYNDMLYLCEKFAPLESLGKYDPQTDPAVSYHG